MLPQQRRGPPHHSPPVVTACACRGVVLWLWCALRCDTCGGIGLRFSFPLGCCLLPSPGVLVPCACAVRKLCNVLQPPHKESIRAFLLVPLLSRRVEIYSFMHPPWQTVGERGGAP